MRFAVVAFILLGHLLATAVGRCQTVWHEELATTGVDASVVEAGHDHDHPAHPVYFGFDADHDHPEETPDHSHIPTPHSVVKAARVQLVLPELVAPAAYVELNWVLQPLAPPTQVVASTHVLEPPLSLAPLSGSITHLLF